MYSGEGPQLPGYMFYPPQYTLKLKEKGPNRIGPFFFAFSAYCRRMSQYYPQRNFQKG